MQFNRMRLIHNRPLLLYSYLATEMLAPFFASFVIMNGIFFLVKLIPFLDIILEYDIKFTDFVKSFSYLFPNMLHYSIPMAAMMGIIIGITRLSNDAEILAFKACGMSLYHFLPPVLLVTLVISTISAYISINLIPAGEVAMKQLFYQLTKEKIDKGIREKEFTAALGDLVVYVEEVDRKTNAWRNVWVSDMREQTTPSITMARTGGMSTDLETMIVTIDLFNGSLHRAEEEQGQIVVFDNYKVQIPLKLPATSTTVVGLSGRTMHELQQGALRYGINSERGREYLVHYHKRLVLPFGCLIMSLMALPLGLQSGPGRRAMGIPLGLGFFIIYYVFYTVAKTLAEDTALPVALAMWTPNSFFLLLAIIAIYRVANEKSLLPGGLGTAWLKLRQTLEEKFKKAKMLRRRRKRGPQT